MNVKSIRASEYIMDVDGDDYIRYGKSSWYRATYGNSYDESHVSDELLKELEEQFQLLKAHIIHE